MPRSARTHSGAIYNWKVDEYPQFRFGSSRASGLIAQEVEKVFPEMVSVDEGGFKGVNYSEPPYLMLQAIRELKAENDSLREQLKVGNQDHADESFELVQLRAEVDRLAAMVRTTERPFRRACSPCRRLWSMHGDMRCR
jgi:hypothetical protein